MSIAYNKRKGAQAEQATADYLVDNGYPQADRSRLKGAKDKGDITGVRPWVIEVKHEASKDIPGWCRELEREMENAGTDRGFVVSKRVGSTDVGTWFAIVPMHLMVAYMHDIDARRELREGVA